MGLFGKTSDEEKERKRVKNQVEKLMKAYDKEEIDGPTYMKQMLDFTTSYSKKKKKR